MDARVWLLAPETAWEELMDALASKGVDVVRLAMSVGDAAASLYDATGLLLVDLEHSEAATALSTGATLVPVVVLADQEASIPAHALRLDIRQEPMEMAHHILEILNQGGNVRRYPRVSVDLPATVDGETFRVRDVSMYGAWIEPCRNHDTGDELEVVVHLQDGAQLTLLGRVVGQRSEGLAVRVRPAGDSDLLLWLHLLLGELAKSPIHADADVFGPLFR